MSRAPPPMSRFPAGQAILSVFDVADVFAVVVSTRSTPLSPAGPEGLPDPPGLRARRKRAGPEVGPNE